MRSVRTRMLVVFIAAAIVVSFFIHWDEMEKGYRDARRDDGALHSTR